MTTRYRHPYVANQQELESLPPQSITSSKDGEDGCTLHEIDEYGGFLYRIEIKTRPDAEPLSITLTLEGFGVVVGLKGSYHVKKSETWHTKELDIVFDTRARPFHCYHGAWDTEVRPRKQGGGSLLTIDYENFVQDWENFGRLFFNRGQEGGITVSYRIRSENFPDHHQGPPVVAEGY